MLASAYNGLASDSQLELEFDGLALGHGRHRSKGIPEVPLLHGENVVFQGVVSNPPFKHTGIDDRKHVLLHSELGRRLDADGGSHLSKVKEEEEEEERKMTMGAW